MRKAPRRRTSIRAGVLPARCRPLGATGTSSAPGGPATPARRPMWALLLPLSGKHAAGRPVDAQCRAASGLRDRRRRIRIDRARHPRHAPKARAQAARSALRAGASLILGPLFANSVTSAVAEEAQAERRQRRRLLQRCLGRRRRGLRASGLAPRSQIKRVLDLRQRCRGSRRYAVLAPSSLLWRDRDRAPWRKRGRAPTTTS